MREIAPGVIGYGNPGTPAVHAPSVTMRQARLALLAVDKLSLVQPAIDALSEPDKSAAQITWDYSTEVQRDNAFVAMLAPNLGLDEAALDALFAVADQL